MGNAKDMAVCMFAFLGWVGLFTVGIFVNSEPFREALISPGNLSLSELVYSVAIAFTTYTYTNVAVLSCLAALIGVCGTRITAQGSATQLTTQTYTAALMRGFFIYLLTASGIVVFVPEPLEAASQAGYVRLGTYISLVSLIMGYKPAIFSEIIDRVVDRFLGAASKPANKEG